MMTMTFRNDGHQESVEIGGLKITVSFTEDAPGNATVEVVVENATQPVTIPTGGEACVTVNGLAMLSRNQTSVTIFNGGVCFKTKHTSITVEKIPPSCPTDMGGN